MPQRKIWPDFVFIFYSGCASADVSLLLHHLDRRMFWAVICSLIACILGGWRTVKRMSDARAADFEQWQQARKDTQDILNEIIQIEFHLQQACDADDSEKIEALADTHASAIRRLGELESQLNQVRNNRVLHIIDFLKSAAFRLTRISCVLDFIGYLFPRSFRQYEWRLSVTDFKLDYAEARQKYQSRLMRTCLVLLFGYKGVKLFLSAQGILWWSRMTRALESLVQVFRK